MRASSHHKQKEAERSYHGCVRGLTEEYSDSWDNYGDLFLALRKIAGFHE